MSTTTRKGFIAGTAAAAAGAAFAGSSFSWYRGTTLAERAQADLWKQYSGAKLNFISENTNPSTAAAHYMGTFKALTGIDVKITQTQLGTVVEKVALDMGSGSAAYQLIYADPYQIMAPYFKGLVDLSKFVNNPKFPAVPGPGGVKDFIPSQLVGCSYFLDRKHLYTFPYDCPTMIWIYRKDLIAKYKSAFMKAHGFDWTPGPHLTWEQYYTMADWMNKNVHEVKYGTGHQAKEYDSLQCDFSNVLYAYGGQYFPGEPDPVDSVGVLKAGKCQLTSPQAVQAATFYQKLLKIAHPSSTTWDWSDLSNAFEAGDIAMMPEWHEFAATLEDPKMSKVAGKVGYAALPRGTKRSCNLWGGTGIAINANASADEQGAAYLFVLWVTSPATEVLTAGGSVGGETPVRTSVYARPDIQAAEKTFSPKYPNLVSMQGCLVAWQPQNVGFRPKVGTWLKCDTIIFTELSKMLAGQEDPATAMKNAAAQFDAANGV